jgi:hypothetical protein
MATTVTWPPSLVWVAEAAGSDDPETPGMPEELATLEHAANEAATVRPTSTVRACRFMEGPSSSRLRRT